VKVAPDVDADKVAALTPGFTGADLANLVNEAALLATRRGADATSLADFGNAVERIVAGLEKRNRLLNSTTSRSSPAAGPYPLRFRAAATSSN
jgi:cell division protease FtsH